jgi:hypothetical protein
VLACLAMLRLRAIVVVVAMLASPLALLARGVFCDPSACNCAMICPMQVSHSQPKCGMTEHAATCGNHQGHHALDYGFIAPFAPAVPLPVAQVPGPRAAQNFVTPYAQLSVDGVSRTPFEPPRS